MRARDAGVDRSVDGAHRVAETFRWVDDGDGVGRIGERPELVADAVRLADRDVERVPAFATHQVLSEARALLDSGEQQVEEPVVIRRVPRRDDRVAARVDIA